MHTLTAYIIEKNSHRQPLAGWSREEYDFVWKTVKILTLYTA